PRRYLWEAPWGPSPLSLQVAPTAARYGRYGYLPRGPATDHAGHRAACAATAMAAAVEELAFVRVEPALEGLAEPPPGWRRAPSREPLHTSLVDIQRSDEEL